MKIIRSKRRTVGLQITEAGELIVRAPMGMPERQIQKIIEKKCSWIEKYTSLAQERKKNRKQINRLSGEEIQKLKEQALKIIPERTAFWAKKVKVSYGRITIRCQKTRWGSCSSKGNLNFNCLLMLAPWEVLDYVIVHELCHRKEMNHFPEFWSEVEHIIPDYKKQKKWLRENGMSLIDAAFGKGGEGC